MSHCIYVLYCFVFLFFMDSSNHHCFLIFIVKYLEIFIIIIFIRIWVINYSKDQIIMLRGVLDEVYDILSELWGYEGVSILLPITHGRLAYGHPYPSPCLFILNISRVDGIWVTYSAVASGSIENFPYLIVLLPFPYSWKS